MEEDFFVEEGKMDVVRVLEVDSFFPGRKLGRLEILMVRFRGKGSVMRRTHPRRRGRIKG